VNNATMLLRIKEVYGLFSKQQLEQESHMRVSFDNAMPQKSKPSSFV